MSRWTRSGDLLEDRWLIDRAPRWDRDPNAWRLRDATRELWPGRRYPTRGAARRAAVMAAFDTTEKERS